MVVLSVIVGIILIMGGIACLFSPAATFLQTGYFIAILMLIYGIVGIVNVIKKREHPLTLIMHILAIIIGIFAIFRPMSTLVLDTILAYTVAAWFVIQGVVTIYLSITVRKAAKGWVWGLIMGIIGMLLGIYSFVHPTLSALMIGILIGIYLIEAGLNMIVLAVAVDSEIDQM